MEIPKFSVVRTFTEFAVIVLGAQGDLCFKSWGKLMRIIIAIILLSSLPVPLAWSDEAADEEAVWALEESYWVFVKNNDIDGYRTLWDEAFVGWPGFSKRPLGKEKIADWIPPLHDNPSEIYGYELTREAVRSFGDVVIAHYLVREYFRSAETGEMLKISDARITHTWQRRGDTWQIITGMSGTWVGEDEDR